MEVYKWEQSGRAQRKKVKKTGTVVLHADVGVDTQFDRLLKAYPIERQGQQSNANKNNNTNSPEMESDEQSLELQTSPFMTAATATRLRDVFDFTSLLPCQAQCYKGIFKARDVILHSRTGSGKTLAYALPIIERYLLLEKDSTKKEIKENKSKLPREPFLLIFVFSNDLALQTSSVLRKLYPELIIFTAGVGEEVNTITELKSNGADVVIGTIPAIDVLIRGRDAITEEEEEEEQEKVDEEMNNDNNNESKSKKNTTLSKHENEKRSRSSEHTSKSSKRTKTDKSENNNNKTNKTDIKKNDNAVVESATQNESEKDNEKRKKGSKNIVNKNNKPNKVQSKKNVDYFPLYHKQHYILSARQVRAVVIDEVDVTLGPRFSNMGRRMKNLLHVIRKANGSLTDGLLHDLRRHHYVLCGATIPNWVIKSGFLGVKKYYYSLVEPGREKLPAQLKCYYLPCYEDQRITTATQLLLNSSSLNSSPETETSLGRTVVFGSPKQLKELEVALHEAEQNDKINNTSAVNSSSVNISENNKKEENKAGKESSEKIEGVYSTLSQTHLSVERIHKHQTDEERAHALERFNNKQAHILLCTDQASRGLDFVDVTTVLMLSLPHYNMAVETFIHRAGRTARVGRNGQCILLYDPHNKSECELNNAIEKTTHISFQRFVPATQINNTGEVTDKEKVKKHETKEVIQGSNNDSKKQKDKNKTSTVNTNKIPSNSSTFCLTVCNPFAFTATQSSYSVSSAPPLLRRVPPTAHQVLQRELNGDLIKRIHIVDSKEMESIVKDKNNNNNESSSSEVVYFQCNFNDVALIKGKLWKYDLKEL